MNEETKEILNQLQNKSNKLELYKKGKELLLNYITNLQTIEQQCCAILSENAELQQENEKLKNMIKKIKDELFKNQFEFTFYGCWLNIKDILESETK